MFRTQLILLLFIQNYYDDRCSCCFFFFLIKIAIIGSKISPFSSFGYIFVNSILRNMSTTNLNKIIICRLSYNKYLQRIKQTEDVLINYMYISTRFLLCRSFQRCFTDSLTNHSLNVSNQNTHLLYSLSWSMAHIIFMIYGPYNEVIKHLLFLQLTHGYVNTQFLLQRYAKRIRSNGLFFEFTTGSKNLMLATHHISHNKLYYSQCTTSYSKEFLLLRLKANVDQEWGGETWFG